MTTLRQIYQKAADHMPARVVLTIVAFLGTVFNYALRVSINLAMVAMVNHTAIPHVNQTVRAEECPQDADEMLSADAALLVGAAGSSASNATDAEKALLMSAAGRKDAEGPFAWDEGIQQLVISSFFWGYTLTQVPGGRLSERFGVKIVMVVSLTLTALCSMLIPLAAKIHFSAVIVLRVIMGFLEGPSFPSISVIISRWAPPWERSRMFTYIKIGGMVGTMTVFPISGMLIDALGWESVFYFFAILTLIWLGFWWLLVFDTPDLHPRISKTERDYINCSLHGVADAKLDLPVPWLKILTCPRMWVATLCAISHGWGSSVLLSLLPTYLKIMMGFNIKANGFLSAVPYLGRVIVAMGFSVFVDWLIKKKNVHSTPIRKAAIAISGYGAALGLLAVSFIKCQILAPIIFLTFAVAATGAGFSGNAPYLVELAPNYAGTTYGILNTGYAFTSIIGPLISGYIIKGEQTIAKWATVFRIAAGFYITTATLFLAVAKAEIQPWNYPEGSEPGGAATAAAAADAQHEDGGPRERRRSSSRGDAVDDVPAAAGATTDAEAGVVPGKDQVDADADAHGGTQRDHRRVGGSSAEDPATRAADDGGGGPSSSLPDDGPPDVVRRDVAEEANSAPKSSPAAPQHRRTEEAAAPDAGGSHVGSPPETDPPQQSATTSQIETQYHENSSDEESAL